MQTVATFEVTYTQFLNHEGVVIDALPPFAEDPETLRTLYKNMVLARAYDTKAIALQRTGKMGTYASIHGQEAISTAMGHAMRKEDVLIPYYRDYAAQIQRGIDMSEIYSYWGGDERGSCFEHNAHDLPISVPIASQCLHAAGIATALKMKKKNAVAVCSLGDGGTSEGDFYEALNVSGAWQLPIVFVVNNNQWAISVPLSKQTAAKTLAQKAIAGGFSGMQVDGNDVIAMREVIGCAIERARTQFEPCLIEALTYRLCDHTTADDASRYQPKEEVEKAKCYEPLTRMKKFLIQKAYWSEADEALYQETCAKLVQAAVDRYLTRPGQSIETIFDYHYKEIPQTLIEQRAIAIEEFTHA